ncbi:transporter family-2 protein [Methylobacterium phyllostachyos]|uniref:Transporter family-2 protein n=1 Tax=Methylobacterium phyllostachyos TaxID=582672 RepID=A0A1H0HYI8_9HYPH|nr:DMT family transporter [Methylobacterium phyllostachyos]SDO24237.1 transporter family-2 protein [Methylobacterium phyllostachyos]
MTILIALLAAAAGILNTVQTGANASLNKALGQPILAALIVAATNAAVYLLAAPFLGLGWPGGNRLASVPWWAWLGGAMGGAYVLAMILLAERLGAAVFTGITVTAAIVTSLLLDHYGWLGFTRHAAGPWRILGGLLMVGGVALLSLF